MSRIIPLLLSLFIISGLFSCGSNPEAGLKRTIRGFLDDNKISSAECKSLQKTIEEDSDLATYVSESALRGLIEEVAGAGQKNRDGSVKEAPEIACAGDKKDPKPSGKTAYNFYLENSGSVLGYLNGRTDFKDALFDLLTRINGYQETVDLNFINDDIYPVDKKVDEFVEFLSPTNVRKYGNTSSSDLNQILKLVVEQLKKDGKPGILVSDFIYSVEKSKNMLDGLSSQKYGTTIVFQNAKAKSRYAVLVVKCSSQFKGSYYTYNSPNAGKAIDSKRPFYIWVIGKKDDILNFETKYRLNSLAGYQHQYTIYDASDIEAPFYTILPTTERKGEFQKTNRSDEVVKDIKGITYMSRGGEKVFQFSVAVDLAGLPVEDSYLMNKNNYTLSSNKGDKFTLERIQALNGVIKENDRRFARSATHVLVLSTEKISTGVQDLSIQLEKKVPQWIANSSTLDDTNIEGTKDKTFGFAHLIEGVSEAYVPKGSETNFFKLSLTLNR